MAASDGIRQYWTALLARPELVAFDYLAAQRIWQKYFVQKGPVHFMGRNDYITFMQALMMDGVKGTALISYLGSIYQAASDPSASLQSLGTTLVRKAYVGLKEYEDQIKSLEKGELGWVWKNGAAYSCSFIFDQMVNNQDISPSDLA